MAKVVIENVYKIYPGPKGADVTAVEDFDLTVENEEFMVFVGPSGCGKSTTLRMIAGLEEISRGSIYIDDKKVNDTPPKDRDIAMVFQNYALYPHMTVRDNMAFGLKLRNFASDEIKRRVNEAAQILNLSAEMLARKPKALSGGQRQRVALGRAIVRKPKVFLFDEPLSNLDAKMRVQMRTEIAKLHSRLASTMIYVTHDQVEAMTMGDRICIMRDGRIQQVAQPLDIYNRPANMFVAAFIGNPPMNFFEGTLVAKSGKLWFESSSAAGSAPSLRLQVASPQADKLASWENKSIVLGLRPEDIEDVAATSSPANPAHVFRARLDVVEPLGAETCLYLAAGTHEFISRLRGQILEKTGALLELAANMDHARFFAPADKARFKSATGAIDTEKWQAASPLII